MFSCFYEKIWNIIFKLSLLSIFIWSPARRAALVRFITRLCETGNAVPDALWEIANATFEMYNPQGLICIRDT